MTVVAALVHDHHVWMGGDSAAVDGDDLTIHARPKVWERDGILFGYCESFRLGQLLEYRLRLPEQRCADDLEYLATVFVDEIRKVIHKGGLKSDEETLPGSLLIGYRGGLYGIESDLAVIAIDTYAAVGCGAPYALGSLASTSGDPHQRLAAALAAADRHCIGVARPFTIIDQE